MFLVCTLGLRRREEHHNTFNWQHDVLILYLNLSRLLQAYCCYDPVSFTQFTSPVAVKYCTAFLYERINMCVPWSTSLLWSLKCTLRAFTGFQKPLLRGVIIEVVIFSLMLFVCNWEFGGKSIMFIYIFSPQCNMQGLLIYTIFLW